MPIFEYECPCCGTFEMIQRPTDKELKYCPTCAEHGEKRGVTKLVSAAAFHLKGNGWYKTDYASKSSSSTKSSNSKGENGSGSGSSVPKTGEKPTAPCGAGCGCSSNN